MNQSPKRVADLSPQEKRALLTKVLQQKASEPRSCPLSFGQERLWFLDQLEPGNPFYNIPAAFRVTGPIDLAIAEQSLNAIVQRHEVLRTTFASEAGRPVQVIAPALPVPLPVVDLRERPEPEREAEVRRLAAAAARCPFDLAGGPLWRVTVLRLGQEDHVVLVTMHHIISDGWSIGVFIREMGALYEACTTGTPSLLPELPIQYADFAVWQRQWLQGEVLEAQLAYWCRQLADVPGLDLPTDRPRPPVQTFRGATHHFALSRALSEALTALSRREGVTLFMTLLAAFLALLQRYTGQDDFAVGTPMAGRTRREVEGLIGFFVNTLVLRTDLGGNPSFRELLGRVREVCLGAYAHQDVPFEKLVEALQPQRDLSRTPLFQVLLVLRPPLPSVQQLRLTMHPIEVDSGTAQCDLTLFMLETAQDMRGWWAYNTDLFEAATMRRLTGHFETLLEGLVAHPEARLADLPLLSDAERQQLLVAWNDTAVAYPQDQCLHQLFEGQVERTPDAIAVVFEAEQLTYRELNRRANQLAHHLRALGVGPEVRVGICVERSLEMVVGLLGILKAGGAYVPLDPAYPPARLAFMLQDAQASVLVTQARLLNILLARNARVVCLDADWETIAGENEASPASAMTPENLAYVIYTSGSTGQPKGVMLTHQAVGNTLCWLQATFALGPDDVVAQKTSASFTDSVWEFFWPLLVGTPLAIIPDQAVKDPVLFYTHLHAQRITVTQFVPPLMTAFVEAVRGAGEAMSLPQLRWVFNGGEALPVTTARAWYAQFRRAKIANIYGMTESAIYATHYIIDTCPAAGEGSIPLGRPIANTRVYVLDKHDRLCLPRVMGEICLGGVGLARGYLDRLGLTAERFVPDPFSAVPGARLYRTGDLGRTRPDGTLEYLGRLDHQVQMRGFRVELGEIEAVLKQHAAVREAVVMARETAPGDPRLVAYVVPYQAPPPLVSELRSFLKEKLPEYMVPSAVVFLEALPLTPNGKVDRRTLPDPDVARPALAAPFVAPRTPVEQALAALWAEVLGLERVGIHDQFFELGGHSLLATQVLARVRSTFEVELPLRRLFEQPTVAGLATSLEAAQRAAVEPLAPPLRPVARGAPLPLSFAQQRLWFLDQLLLGSPVYHIPVAVRLTGPLDEAAVAQSLTSLGQRHEVLRTTFASEAGRPVQVIAPTVVVPLQVVDLRERPEAAREAEARRLLAAEARQPFDLAYGPLWRVTVLRLADDEHLVLMVIHHIIADGWSLGVLLREVGALYEACTTGVPVQLPALPVQYADFAVWQRQWLQGEVLEAQLAYWCQQLADVPVLELPTDRPRPPMQTFRGATHHFALSRDLAEALTALSRREGVTLFMTLLAAFMVLLQRYTGQDDLVVGTPMAGRIRAELEGLLGFFVNTLVLRTDLGGNPTFRELLGRVREVCLGAYAHQDVPFEQLVEALQPQRDLSRTPLFQVLFVLQQVPGPPLAWPDLTVRPVEVATGTAQCDLTLFLIETEHDLRGAVEYNTDLFEAATMRRLTGHFETLLEGLVAHPEARLADLPLMPDAERQQLLVAWNDTAVAYPQDQCLHQLFEGQVERTPDAIAVVFEAEQLTYRELNRRANQLAHHLRALGVGPEVRVGICVERSLEMVVGLLGILKAGGAYVPLDPAYPPARLAFMLQDAQAPVLVTQEQLLARLPEHGEPRICLDADWEAIAQESEENLVSETVAEHLAYVIYTSGSTGMPKGVEVCHRGILRLLFGVDYVQLDATQIFLQVAPISFDAATFEVWGALLHGARCVLFPAQIPTAESLGNAIQKYGINILWLTASLFNAVVDEAPEVLSDIQRLLIGGEALSVAHVRRALELLPSTQIINGYGPTESTTFTCCYPVPRRLGETIRSIPIGRPIGNTKVYLLDKHLQPVPVGAAGELYIGGAGLARDYLNRPESTAATFIPNPFSREPAARLYKSGDLARYLPDGTIEFLDRLDEQVKIRGFRVELGEIEAVLGQHAAVREAVVVAREVGPGDQRLVAYVVPQPAFAPTLSELRSFLNEKLPAYMVPTALIVLDALPLTPNSKVDRRALPAPAAARPALEAAFVAPRDTLELQLTKMWEKLLGTEPIGVRDNFFELGGHSLLAVRLFAQIEKVCGKNLPLATLFQAPTVEQLAGILHREGWSAPWPSLVVIQPGSSQTPFFCVHEVSGSVLNYRNLSHRLGPDQPFYGLQPQGLDGKQSLYTRIEDMAAHYIQDIRTLQPHGPYVLGGYSFGGIVAFEMAQQLHRQGQEVALLALLDTCVPTPHEQSIDKDVALQSLVQDLGLSLDHLSVSWDYFWQLEPDAQVTYILEQAGIANVALAEVGRAQAHRLLRVLQANVQAMQSYVPQAYPSRVMLFRASERFAITPQDPTMGWGKLAAGGIEVREVPGNHYTMLREPHVQILAKQLQACLQQAQAGV